MAALNYYFLRGIPNVIKGLVRSSASLKFRADSKKSTSKMMKTGPNSDLIGTPALKADSNYSLCSSNWCKLSAFARTRCKRCGFPGIFSFLQSNQPPAVKPNIFINKLLCLCSIKPLIHNS